MTYNPSDLPRTDSESRANAADATAYRSMMDGVDTSRFESQKGMREAARAGMTRKLVDALGAASTSDLSDDAKNSVIGARDAIIARETTVNTTADKVHRTLSDQRAFPVARIEDANAALSDAHGTLTAQAAVFDASMVVAREQLLAAARPAVREGDEATARADARMLLDGVNSSAEMSARIQAYVTDNDDSVAGILSDPRWLKTYLTGRGMADHVKVVEPMLNATVAEAARRSSDKSRAAAGAFLSSLHHYQGAYDATTAMVGTMDPRSKK